MDDTLCDIFEGREFGGDDLFAILERLESDFTGYPPINNVAVSRLASQKSTSSSALQDSETELETSPKTKRLKLTTPEEATPDGQQKMSHITVERNRRKQMNEHLSLLRSLMPCFYVKRGDQASLIGAVVDYITELQQVVQSLEAKKQRKVYSPRLVSSPRGSPLSPRLRLPVSPRTPQPGSPYRQSLQQGISASISNPSSSNSSINDNINELVANSNSATADVEVKFSGPHVLLKTVSHPIPGQALKIITSLQDLPLQILHVNINCAPDHTMLNSFTIKIGIECQLSAEELAQQIQQTFC